MTRIVSLCVGTLLTASLSGCGHIPGIFYGLRTAEPSPHDCVKLGDALTATLAWHIKSVTSGDAYSYCYVMLDNDGASPPLSVDIGLVKATGLLTITVREYRWGSWTAPSNKAEEAADRVVAIAHEQFPNAEITRLPPPQRGPFAP